MIDYTEMPEIPMTLKDAQYSDDIEFIRNSYMALAEMYDELKEDYADIAEENEHLNFINITGNYRY